MENNENKNKNKGYRIFMIGDAMVGKTALLKSLPDMSIETLLTLGLEITDIEISVRNEKITLSVIDLGGKEAFHKFYTKYVETALGGIFVFSLANRKSFENLPYYQNLIKDTFTDKPFILVGNKSDMDREVSYETAASFADENDMPYFETSAITKENIIEAFTSLSEMIIKKISK